MTRYNKTSGLLALGSRFGTSVFLVTNFFILFIYFSLDFQTNYPLVVPSLCTDFREDIEFHFSLGWQAILRNFLAPRYPGLAIVLGANVRTLL